MQIKWKKINNYCIEHNKIYISKYNLIDGPIFAMWHNTKLIKVFNTSQEAKDHALLFIQEQSARTN